MACSRECDDFAKLLYQRMFAASRIPGEPDEYPVEIFKLSKVATEYCPYDTMGNKIQTSFVKVGDSLVPKLTSRPFPMSERLESTPEEDGRDAEAVVRLARRVVKELRDLGSYRLDEFAGKGRQRKEKAKRILKKKGPVNDMKTDDVLRGLCGLDLTSGRGFSSLLKTV